MEFLYIDSAGFEVIKYMRAIFNKYPGFSYVKIWADYVAVSGSHLDIKLARNIEGRKYDFDKDFWALRKGTLPDGKISITPGPGLPNKLHNNEFFLQPLQLNLHHFSRLVYILV